jgi:hypothetical protein
VTVRPPELDLELDRVLTAKIVTLNNTEAEALCPVRDQHSTGCTLAVTQVVSRQAARVLDDKVRCCVLAVVAIGHLALAPTGRLYAQAGHLYMPVAMVENEI